MKWTKFPAADFGNVLLSFGFVEGAADSYVEMFIALDKHVLFEDIERVKPKIEGTTIDAFARKWGKAYRELA